MEVLQNGFRGGRICCENNLTEAGTSFSIIKQRSLYG
jgi:hypothetical protein